MFSLENRENVREYVLNLAETDKRIVSAAIVGSYALSKQDRWSDIDLTFGVDEKYAINDVLEDWTRLLIQQFKAVTLFDLPHNSTIYRVFILPNCLEIDISFTPASGFGSISPNFKLLFGTYQEHNTPQQQSIEPLLGYAVHHCLHARFCIERGRFWNAEYWINAIRNHALTIATLTSGLNASLGKGYDDLPFETRQLFKDSYVHSFERTELLRCLKEVILGLIVVSNNTSIKIKDVTPQLHELIEMNEG
jgi:predicted nucleotidyltransferase